jgi:hypothetical protein
MSEYIERPIDFTGPRTLPGRDSPAAPPEVFLKAVTAVRNLGHARKDCTTVNFGFLDHCRPRVNVVERPHSGAGGPGIGLRGHHELMPPWVAAALLEREP